MQSNFDWLGFFTGLAAVLGVIGAFIMQVIGSRRAASKQDDAANEIKTVTEEATVALKVETKKVAEANVAIASLEGENRGRLEEQASPKVDATIPGKTELSQPAPKPRRPKTRETAIKPRKSAKKK